METIIIGFLSGLGFAALFFWLGKKSGIEEENLRMRIALLEEIIKDQQEEEMTRE
jgi:hypothetical protein